MDRSSQVVLVTGSSSGIGAAVARRFAADGARVVVNSRSSVAEGEALAAELDGAVYVRGDVADLDDARRLVATTLDTFGRLDVLVNNAGTTRNIPHDDVDAVTPEVWDEILGVNVVGTWNVTQAALPALREHAGVVINVTSLAGVRQLGSSLPYAVSKAALNHMTRLLAKALGGTGVRVNAVAPGLITTPWTADWDDMHAAVEAGAPLRRVGTPEDVAAACVLLVDSTYTTGEVLVVDGGLNLLM